MNPHLRRLYQSAILEHSRTPLNRRSIDPALRVESRNPACGDAFTIYLQIDDGVILDASFEGSGCAIATASASLMTQQVKGKSLPEVAALAEHVRAALSRDGVTGESGELSILAVVRHFPARLQCAALVWHTLGAVTA